MEEPEAATEAATATGRPARNSSKIARISATHNRDGSRRRRAEEGDAEEKEEQEATQGRGKKRKNKKASKK